MKKLLVLLLLGAVGCALDTDPNESATDDDIATSNKLASNKLASNKLASNKLAANKLAVATLPSQSTLIDSADGREVLSYILKCALPASVTLTITATNGTAYPFPGEIGLAPAWTTRALTVTEQHWVSACVLSRTNYFGIAVPLSLRGSNPALAQTLAEDLQYETSEAAFYGNLFSTPQVEYACIALPKELNVGSQSLGLRDCAVPTGDGTTTMCGFTFTGGCGVVDSLLQPACLSLAEPYSNCKAGTAANATRFQEVISVVLESN
jgi:hypothetical protein